MHFGPGGVTYVKFDVDMSENQIGKRTHITEVINHKKAPFSERIIQKQYPF